MGCPACGADCFRQPRDGIAPEEVAILSSEITFHAAVLTQHKLNPMRAQSSAKWDALPAHACQSCVRALLKAAANLQLHSVRLKNSWFLSSTPWCESLCRVVAISLLCISSKSVPSDAMHLLQARRCNQRTGIAQIMTDNANKKRGWGGTNQRRLKEGLKELYKRQKQKNRRRA